MDKDVEHMVDTCSTCAKLMPDPKRSILHPWEKASGAWQRIHIDHAGPYLGHSFLLVTDAYTKWIDAYPVSSQSAQVTIEKLRQSFAIQGLPKTIVSDNGSGFVSEEFEEFAKKNGIRHITTAPYHPASNGLAERTVQTLKRSLAKLKENSKESINTQVSRFLFAHRNTPNAVTGVAPSELVFKHKPQTRLDQLKPDLDKRFQHAAESMVLNHPQENRSFEVGANVLARMFGKSGRWMEGVVVEKNGPVMYTVQVEGGYCKRHIDQLRKNVDDLKLQQADPTKNGLPASVLPNILSDIPQQRKAPVTEDTRNEEKMKSSRATESNMESLQSPRRSERNHRVPGHLEAYQR